MSRERLAELVSSASYGSVLVLAALAVIGVSEVALGHGSELVAGVGLATFLAHLFAELLGGHVRHDDPLGRDQVTRAVVDGSPILAATVLPAVALGLGRLEVIGDDTARVVAIAVAEVQLIAIGAYVARLDTARPGGNWGFAVATGVVGLAVVLFVVLLGH
jgi:hypothetical protein